MLVMRRDMDFVRELLLEIANGFETVTVPYEGVDDELERLIYHLDIMSEAKLIEFDDESFGDARYIENAKLTWKGNDFLDAIENDNVWGKVKEVASDKGFEVAKMSFDILLQLAIQQGKQIFNLN